MIKDDVHYQRSDAALLASAEGLTYDDHMGNQCLNWDSEAAGPEPDGYWRCWECPRCQRAMTLYDFSQVCLCSEPFMVREVHHEACPVGRRLYGKARSTTW